METMKTFKNEKIKKDIEKIFGTFEAKLAIKVLTMVENNEITSYTEFVKIAEEIFNEKQGEINENS